MNEAMNNLLTRRSIRKYKAEQITDAELNAVIEAGLYAPSAMGKQTAIIVAVQDADTIAKLQKMNAAVTGRPDGTPFYGAPTVLIVLAENGGSAIQDGSLCMGNLLNAAHALGLGSCWINRAKEVFETEEGKALLKEWGIEGDYIGIGNCILGYPDCDAPTPADRKPNRVYYVK